MRQTEALRYKTIYFFEYKGYRFEYEWHQYIKTYLITLYQNKTRLSRYTLESKVLRGVEIEEYFKEVVDRMLNQKQAQDIYKEAAAKHFNVKPEEVTKEQRWFAKNCLFNSFYGNSSEQLNKDPGIKFNKIL